MSTVYAHYLVYGVHIINIKEYISDEQWYVSAAVNIYRSLFGLQLISKYNETHYQYTIIYESNCSVSDVERALNSLNISYTMLHTRHYSKLSAIIVATNTIISKILLKKLACIEDIMPGIAPDERDINKYLNMEHPPLVKYFLGLSMLFLGVNSYAWRIPALIAGFLLLSALILLTYIYSKRDIILFSLGYTIIVYSVFYDKLYVSLTYTSLLDGFVSLFTILSLLAAIYEKSLASSILVGLAGSSKMTGFFAIPWLYISLRIDGKDVKRSLLYSIVIPVLVFLIVNIPIILTYGFSKWLGDLYGAIKWHTSSRPPGPPSTTPLGLLVTANPFPMYYVDGVEYLIARCNPGVCILGVVVSVLSAILFTEVCLAKIINNRFRKDLYPLVKLALLFISIWTGYLAVYLAGNHTLYTFYSIHFHPLLLLMDVALIANYKHILLKPFSLIGVLRKSRSIISYYCYNAFIEVRKIVSLVKLDKVTKTSIIAFIYLYILSIILVFSGLISPASTILLEPCIHHYGFNPVDSFVCLYSDQIVRFVLLSLSLVLYLDYIVRYHRSDADFLFSLLLVFPVIVSSITSSLFSLFLPILLFAAINVADDLLLGFLLGLVAPNPLFSATFYSKRKSLIGFIAGYLLAHVTMLLQSGIDLTQQLEYTSVYALAAVFLILLGIFMERRLPQPYVQSIVLAVLSIASVPCGMLAVVYSVYWLYKNERLVVAASLPLFLFILGFYYDKLPSFPLIGSSLYLVEILVSAIIVLIGVWKAWRKNQ